MGDAEDSTDANRQGEIAQIKEAVSYQQESNSAPEYVGGQQKVMIEEYPDMQPSILTKDKEGIPEQSEESYAPQIVYPEQQYSDQYNQQYSDQQYPQYSQNTISEIAEQITTEKLSSFRTDIEKALNMKTAFESKIEFIDERLKRIEKVIDRLQLSVLQKVGDYVNNVDDIKKELVETQKSFKSLLEKKHSQHSKSPR